jgi:hypothetical protein
MKKIEILFHILVLTFITLTIILVLFWLVESIWVVNNLHNKCVADCIEWNKLNPGTCMC